MAQEQITEPAVESLDTSGLVITLRKLANELEAMNGKEVGEVGLRTFVLLDDYTEGVYRMVHLLDAATKLSVRESDE